MALATGFPSTPATGFLTADAGNAGTPELAAFGDPGDGSNGGGSGDGYPGGGGGPGGGLEVTIDFASVDGPIHEGNACIDRAAELTGAFSGSFYPDDPFIIEVWIDSDWSGTFDPDELDGYVGDGGYSYIDYDQGTFSYFIFSVPDDGASAADSGTPSNTLRRTSWRSSWSSRRISVLRRSTRTI